MSKISKMIDAIGSSNFEEAQKAISENIKIEHYDILMARKVLEKIYRNSSLTYDQKYALIELIKNEMPTYSSKIENTYNFLEHFIPIGDNILSRISSQIVCNFPNSLAVFYYCLGLFVDENPDMIGEAKRVIMYVAKKALDDDIKAINYQLSISIENIYAKTKHILNSIYQEAILYGVIVEKYDAIAFGSEYIENINIDKIPRVIMKLTSSDFEYGLQCGIKHHNYITNMRYDEDAGVIESFYKCMICKYCNFFDDIEVEKEIAFKFLKRQFANRNQTDLFFFFTGDFQSYMLSILAYIYTQLLLLFFCSKDTMKMISKSDIKKNMLWGDVINSDIFNDCYSLIISDETFNKFFWAKNDDIIIGRWQLDLDLSIVELAKKISLNSKFSHNAGKNSNYFGKDVYEKLVKSLLENDGWKLIPSSVKIKNQKQTQTDIDFVAYNNGYVIVGQIKFANSGRTRYDIWKARQSITKAVSQMRFSLQKFSQDQNLLFSILKKYDFCKKKEDIKQVVPVVITSSSYFIGEYKQTKIPVVSWDMFSQIIKSLSYYNTLSDIEGYFSNLDNLYNFGLKNEITLSEIECEDFYIQYEEYD